MADYYEPRTRDEIHSEMLDSARDDVDKREGSVVYDMTAITAEQIEMLDYELRAVYLNGFADTADLPFLIRRAAEMGIEWKDAVKARGQIVVEGLNGTLIPSGFRVFTDSGIAFQTIENAIISGGQAVIAAEAVVGGSAGNIGPGEISQYERTVAGINSVTNNEPFDGGVDAESAESLLNRYLLKVRKPITSGNVYHYELWATEVPGVAAAKVFPLYNGPGTVRVVVIGEDGRSPSQDVVNNVAEHIEAERPIGATVEVVPITEFPIDISAKLTLAGDLEPADVKDAIAEAIGTYFLEATNEGIVRYTHVGEAILRVSGVIDYEDLLINGGTTNIPIADEAVAVVGEVTLT